MRSSIGRTFRILALMSAVLMSVAGLQAATDQDQAKPSDQMNKSSDQMSSGQKDFTPKLTKVDWMIGHKVMSESNSSSEQIGSLHDVVLDSSLERVSYAVISTGGILGVGEKMHAVPWDALHVNADSKTITMAADRKTLEDSPSFDRSHWPEAGDTRWSTESTSYWHKQSSNINSADNAEAMNSEDADTDNSAVAQGAKTDQTARSAIRQKIKDQMASGGQYFNYRRATEIIGLNVKNKQEESLGEIENLVLDMREGRVVYCYVSFGGTLGIGEKMAAVPWSAVQVRPRLNIARLDTDRKTLDAIAFEQGGKEPDLANRDEAQKLYARFNEEPYWEVYGYVAGEEKGEHMMKPDAWMSGSKYMTSFNPKTIVTFNGTIENVGTFRPATDAAPGIRLRILTDDKKTMTVQAGPRSFAAQKGFQFNYGDQLKVTGSKTQVDGKDVILSTKIEKSGQTLELRDENGQPKWDAKDIK